MKRHSNDDYSVYPQYDYITAVVRKDTARLKQTLRFSSLADFDRESAHTKGGSFLA